MAVTRLFRLHHPQRLACEQASVTDWICSDLIERLEEIVAILHRGIADARAHCLGVERVPPLPQPERCATIVQRRVADVDVQAAVTLNAQSLRDRVVPGQHRKDDDGLRKHERQDRY